MPELGAKVVRQVKTDVDHVLLRYSNDLIPEGSTQADANHVFSWEIIGLKSKDISMLDYLP